MEDEEQVDSLQSPINGTVRFGSGCTPAERTKVQQAVDLIVEEVNLGSTFHACLKDGILSEPKGASAEEVLARLRDNLPTEIDCKKEVCGGSGPVGCASIGISAERLTLQKEYVGNASARAVAGVILHEVAHNKGWNHPGSTAAVDYKYRVTNQVNRCMSTGVPAGLRRGAAPGATELAPSGGETGNPFERHCPGNEFLVGSQTIKTSAHLNRHIPRCQLTVLPGIGETKDATITSVDHCPANMLVVGVAGREDDLIIGFDYLCADRAAVASGQVNPPTVRLSTGPWVGGRGFTRMCPAGMAGKHLYGQAGARVDQLRLGCESLSERPRPARGSLSRVGAASGPSQGASCLGNGAMVGLFGTVSAGGIGRLGAVCRPTRTEGALGLPTLGSSAEEHIIDAWGGWGGTSFDDRCGPGTALVGLRFQAGTRVQRVRGVCAVPSQWSASSGAATLTLTPERGTLSGTVQVRSCPRGQYLVGLNTWGVPAQGELVRSVVPVCQRLDLPPLLAP